MKQREHETIGDIDYYKEIDDFIPLAMLYADNRHKDKESVSWTRCFLARMNSMLKTEGLRV